MPHVSAMGQKYDSGDFTKVLDAALDAADWRGFPARQQEAVQAGKRRGIGLAYYLEATGGSDSERAEIRFSADGYVDVYVGTQSSGQGHETAYVQLTAAQLGVDGEKIRIHQGDTDTIPTGGGTGGARSLYSEGQALRVAGMSVIEKGRQQAGAYLEAAEADIVFADGRFSIAGTDRGVDILTLAAQNPGALNAAEVAAINAHTFPNGCHIAEVEVDPETGVARVARYLVMDDVGKVVNPMIVRGQVHGGVVQGVGQAIYERVVYDAESGQLLSGSLTDYALPRADDMPDIRVEFIEIPCVSNPLGVKGAGEAGAVGSPPAVVNAIIDALKQDGVISVDMPATPERLWKAIVAAKAA
jgi:carbon-monoxide dehydrogenase large subunit